MPFCELLLSAPLPPDDAPPPPLVHLGSHIRARRRALGFRQRDAAQAIGVSLATFRNWEAGRADIRNENYPAVFRFLDTDPNPEPRSLQERLRAARLSEGLSQKAVAEGLGLDPGTLRAWEAGRVQTCSRKVRQRILEYVARVEEASRRSPA